MDEAGNISSDDVSASRLEEPFSLVTCDCNDENISSSASPKTKARIPITEIDEEVTPQNAICQDSSKTGRGSSGGGKHSIHAVEELNDFGTFIPAIDNMTGTQAEQEKINIEMEVEKAKKGERFERLRMV